MALVLLAACGTDTTATAADMAPDDATCTLPPVTSGGKTATFHVTNTTPFDVFLVESSTVCDAFAIASVGDLSAVAIPLAAGFACGCECAGPPPFTATLRLLLPNQSTSLTWDGNGFFGCTRTVQCPSGNNPAAYDELSGESSPVVTGTYRVEIGGWSSPPAGCTPSGNGTWNCTSACSDVSCAYTPSQPQQLCATQAGGAATFTLTGGDTTVEVAIQ